MKTLKKQIIIILLFSMLASIAAIIHGIYMDLDLSEIGRLTIGGIILTLLIIFPAILLLEKIFDITNSKELGKINKRLNKLENKLNKKRK